MRAAPNPLNARELRRLPPPLHSIVLVTGKGGVGKTTVAAGLAAAAVEHEGSAVLVEFGGGEAGRRAFGGRSPRGLEHVVIVQQDAMQRLATQLFRSGLLAKAVLGNFAIKRFLRASPAFRELAMLESVRFVAEQNPKRRVVVDLPATGHGVAWLRVPAQLRDMLRSGALFELCARICQDLVSPDRSSIAVVTLPEALVLRETLELCEAIDREVGMKPARLYVNRFPAGLPIAALADARVRSQGGGTLGVASRELVTVLEAREAARNEALHVLSNAPRVGEMTPVVLPEAPADPTVRQVVQWLGAEAVW